LKTLRTLLLSGAVALAASAASADTFTLECDYNDVAAITGTFTMTPGDWSTVANVNITADLPYGNLAGLIVHDHLTFNAAPTPATGNQGFITFTNTANPSVGLQVAFTPQQVASNIVQTYSVVSAIGTHESSAWDSTLTMAWDYFDGSIKDNVTGAAITTGVPEPSTWAMLLIGFVGLGFAFRHRRRMTGLA
jgi:hypothetical protein